MRFRKFYATILASLGLTGFASAANANTIQLTVDRPVNITYKIAHKSKDGQTELSSLRSARIDGSLTIPIKLHDYSLAGIVLISVDGHQLPPEITQFDKPKQCAMATDKERPSGRLDFSLKPHSITCRSFGGVYG